MTEPLAELAYWQDWQHHVVAGLPHFAAQGMYVEQDSVDPGEVARVAQDLDAPIDVGGQTRDVRYGGRTFDTSKGSVTRMWVDANVEIAFLRRTLTLLKDLDVLEIGAGYGRLAVMLAPLVRSYACVDAVPISSILCRYYTAVYAPHRVAVYDPPQFLGTPLRPSLAINIHSWNECSLAQITRWLEALDALQVRYLFTVSHGRIEDQTAYRTCESGEPSFKPLLEARYTLVHEEPVGIGRHPHALWVRP